MSRLEVGSEPDWDAGLAMRLAWDLETHWDCPREHRLEIGSERDWVADLAMRLAWNLGTRWDCPREHR